MTITDWPPCERPREKLLECGAAALSDAELLAVFLRVGAAGKNAVDLARELMVRFGSLTRLFTADAPALLAIRGMGCCQVRAEPDHPRTGAASAGGLVAAAAGIRFAGGAVRSYLRLTLSPLHHEVFLCLFLDARNRLIASEELFRGTLTHTSVHPREVARQALVYNAASVIVAHNHPSSVATPSQSDLQMTRLLARALELIDVRLLDHFIPTRPSTRSRSISNSGPRCDAGCTAATTGRQKHRRH
jgi:DNA repair protein RadC